MSLSTLVIDRLFSRMGATYGAAWDRSLGQAPVSDVKTAWAHELSGFSGQLPALAWALENLPETAPNVIVFRNLCRKAPAPDVPRLPDAPADPERVRAELAKLEPVRASAAAVPFDHKAWAHRIIAREAAGEDVKPISLRFAKEALRAHLEPAAA